MITVRRSKERGHANHDWLDTYHTFSFARYIDREYMGFRALRVINEDRIAPGEGFGTHPHENMEIITYILDGELEHKDSLGHVSVLKKGEIQRITAGSGITHSEYNHSQEAPVHLLQIWITPNETGLSPNYDQKSLSFEKADGLQLIASGKERAGLLSINQDVDLFVGVLKQGEQVRTSLGDERYGWFQVARGSVELNGLVLSPGDGASLHGEDQLEIKAITDAEILLFDLA